jgi:hypothetical protein
LGPCMIRIGSRFAISNNVNVTFHNISPSSDAFVASVFCLLAQFS